jgi:hypothetical protein
MKYIRILTLSAFAVAWVICLLTPRLALSVQQKPHPPLRISIEPARPEATQQAINAGEVVEFLITATSMVDATMMRVQVTLSDGVELVTGSLSWAGASKKNEAKILPITIKIPLKGDGTIRAHLSITLSEGSVFSTSSEYALGGKKQPKPESTHPVKKDRKGHGVVEYR